MTSGTKLPAVKVECHPNSIGDDRPVSFRLDDQRLVIEKIVDQWPGQDVDYFKILADDGKGYLLTRHKNSSEWALKKVFQI